MGLPLSAAAHAGLIALALWALPWLKARPGLPVPVVEVSRLPGQGHEAVDRAPETVLHELERFLTP